MRLVVRPVAMSASVAMKLPAAPVNRAVAKSTSIDMAPIADWVAFTCGAATVTTPEKAAVPVEGSVETGEGSSASSAVRLWSVDA